jgi:hypothetical protein
MLLKKQNTHAHAKSLIIESCFLIYSIDDHTCVMGGVLMTPRKEYVRHNLVKVRLG